MVGEPSETLDAHFEGLAKREELREVMQELTDDQREVLTLRFALGLSHAEAARLMDRNEPAVRALQFRAIAALRDLMVKDAG